jgi:ATP-dependent Lhr-like helicase
MDVDGLADLVSRLRSGEVVAHFVDSVEPSVLSHEIVNSEPYTYLDDAPLEERRSRQVQLRRGLPVEARDLSLLDPAAWEKIRADVAAAPRSADELHDLLLATLVHPPRPAWQPWFAELEAAGRAMTLALGAAPEAALQRDGPGAGELALWCATERRPWAEALFPEARFAPDLRLAGSVLKAAERPEPGEAAAFALRGHLEVSGPVTAAGLARASGLPPGTVEAGLARLEADGFAMQGRFDPSIGDGPQWCARHLLARAHSYSQGRARREVQPVSAQEFMRFLLRWQHVAPGTQRQGRSGALSVVEQLQGYELAAGAWEEAVLPARTEGYRRDWLEDLCLSGEVSWGRLSLRGTEGEGGAGTGRRGAAAPSRATPVTFCLRPDLGWLMAAKRGGASPEEPRHGPARDVLDALRAHGAMFASDLPAATGRLPSEVEEGLWDLVARGLVTADGFGAVRSLFSRRQDWQRRHLPGARAQWPRLRAGPHRLGRGLRRGGEGRWALLVPGPLPAKGGTTGGPAAVLPTDELAELVAGQLLARWGVVFWELASHEGFSVPWREVLWALRRFEARGIARGGRFVNGFAGEQYALPEAVDELRHIARSQGQGELVRLSAADPLNLSGVLLPGKRVPALRTRSVVFLDGLIVGEGPARPAQASTRSAPSRAAMAPGSGPR